MVPGVSGWGARVQNGFAAVVNKSAGAVQLSSPCRPKPRQPTGVADSPNRE